MGIDGIHATYVPRFLGFYGWYDVGYLEGWALI